VTQRSDQYVKQLDAIFGEFLALADQVNDAHWTTVATDDGRQINVMLDHVANAQANLSGLVRLIAANQDLPTVNMDVIEAGNRQHMAEAGSIDRATVLAKLADAMRDYRTLLPSLRDADLDRAKPLEILGGETSAATLIEQAMIGHANGHLPPLSSAVAAF